MKASWNRIVAILRHSWYHGRRSPETWVDLFWMTTIQFLIFGFISKVFVSSAPELGALLLIGFLLWEITRISQYCITVSILWEIWSKALNTLFVSPLTMWEWIAAQTIGAFVKTLFVIGTLGVVSSAFFHVSIFQLGGMLAVYFALLFLFGISMGMLLTALLLRFNTEIQSVAWGLIYLLQPISAVFYPVEALPQQIRWVAYLSPITYVMQTAQKQLSTGEIDWPKLGISFVLNILCGILSWMFLQSMFRYGRKTGSFARLGN